MMLEMLTPPLTTWAERSFPPPVDIAADTFPSDPVLYLYLAQHNEALQFPTITIDSRKWDVWHLGETDNLRRRHSQHLQQVGTCKRYYLVDLLSGFRSVREIDMSSPIVSHKIAAGQKDFPEDKHNYTACRNSIGWSAVTYVSWIRATEMGFRVREEEAMIEILGPPLNWLRRRA